MAAKANHVIMIVRRYIRELQNNDIPVQKALIFGSYATENPREESDIDVAIVSTGFTGDRFEDRRKIVPLRRKIDNRIEPIPIRPIDFIRGGNLIDEIKKTGIPIKLKRESHA